MRMRTIKPGFFTNEDLADLSPLTRILFAGLWCYADREGRFEWRPRRIKVEILPYDKCNVRALLDELTAHGFIQRYTDGTEEYGLVISFQQHQRPHVNEQPSILPCPPQGNGATTKAVPEHNQGGAMDAQSLGVRTVVETVVGGLNNDAPPAADAAPKPRAKRAPSGEVQETLTWFAERYAALRGSPYPVTAGDAVALSRLRKTFEMAEIRVRLERGLTADDDWLDKTDRSLKLLAGQINKPLLLGIAPKRNDKIGHAAPSGIEEFHNGRVSI